MTPEAIARLHSAAFAPEPGWSADEFRGLLATPGTRLTTAEGAFLLGRAIAGEAEILTLATAPAARRRGLGRAVLRDFVDLAQREGCDRLFLEVAVDNGPALALYAGNGFVEVGRRRAYAARRGQTAVDALIMELRINAQGTDKW